MAYEKNRRRPPQEDDGTLIEGRNAVLETLRSGRAVDKIFLAEGAHLADVAAEAKKHGVPTVTCDRRKLDHMSVTGTHQGVIAQTAAQEYVSLDDIFRVAEERGETPLIVVCDGIEDPHNLGAIIRSAETAGAHGVIILDELKERGVWLFGAEADGTVDLYEAPFDRATAIVIGSEGQGLSRLTRDKCDYIVSIPMRGRVNSLNASNAAAVLLFEALRRRLGH